MTLSTRQEEIINAAIKLIAEKSIQGLTIKNLSSQIGLTEGAIYRHFNSKFDILLTILSSFLHEADKSLENACNSDDPALKQIELIFMYNFNRFTERPAIASVIFSESIFQNDKRLSTEVLNLLNKHESTLKCIIENGQKNGEIRADVPCDKLISMIIGSIRYMVTKWRLTNFEFDLKKEGAILLDMIKMLIKK